MPRDGSGRAEPHEQRRQHLHGKKTDGRLARIALQRVAAFSMVVIVVVIMVHVMIVPKQKRPRDEQKRCDGNGQEDTHATPKQSKWIWKALIHPRRVVSGPSRSPPSATSKRESLNR